VLQLGQRARGALLDPRDRAARSGPQTDSYGHRLLVVQQQRRQGTATAEAIAAGDPRPRVDRIAELAQPADVVPDSPAADPEPIRQFWTGPVTASLEQREEAQQARGSLEHPPILTFVEERSLPQLFLT
jgi:hypothetical protein